MCKDNEAKAVDQLEQAADAITDIIMTEGMIFHYERIGLDAAKKAAQPLDETQPWDQTAAVLAMCGEALAQAARQASEDALSWRARDFRSSGDPDKDEDLAQEQEALAWQRVGYLNLTARTLTAMARQAAGLKED